MPSPFPGVDPYLESHFWTSFHTQLCSDIARRLTPSLGPRYIALVEERLVIDRLDDAAVAARGVRPDVTVASRQASAPGSSLAVAEPPLRLPAPMEEEVPVHFIEIHEATTMRVVTVIEVLSPANKTGDGRTDYLRKRRAVLNSDVNLIEVDLLRGGERVPMAAELPNAAYFAIVHRAALRPMADIWPIGIRDILPQVPVPLLPPDADAQLDLQAAYASAFDSVDYSRAIDYARPLMPPLPTEDADWVRSLLRKRTDT